MEGARNDAVLEILKHQGFEIGEAALGSQDEPQGHPRSGLGHCRDGRLAHGRGRCRRPWAERLRDREDRGAATTLPSAGPDTPGDPDADELPPAPLPSMAAFDPRYDPHPGQLYKAKYGFPQRVVERTADRLRIHRGSRRIWISIRTWEKWVDQEQPKLWKE